MDCPSTNYVYSGTNQIYTLPCKPIQDLNYSLIFAKLMHCCGAVAQLGERLTGSQKVRGSNPLSSTIQNFEAKPNLNRSIRPNSQSSLSITLNRLIEGFLLSCKVENKSPATISFYKNILDKFRWFLEKNNIQDIDANTIRSFLGYLKDTTNRWGTNNARANRPVSATTVKSYYIGLSALFTWAMEEGLIEHNSMANVKKPKLPNRTVKGLEPDIMKTLMNTFNGKGINDLRNKAMLLMFLDTGLRLSELTNLKLSDS